MRAYTMEDALIAEPQKLTDLFANIGYREKLANDDLFIGGVGAFCKGVSRFGVPARTLLRTCAPHCTNGVATAFRVVDWSENEHHPACTVLIVHSELNSRFVCVLETEGE